MRTIIAALLLATVVPISLLTCSPALAQIAPAADKKQPPDEGGATMGPEGGGTTNPDLPPMAPPNPSRDWTTIEIVLSFAVLVFGAFVLGLQTYLIIKAKVNWTANTILRFNGLTLVVTAGVLLVTAGYSNQQMTPMIGLLGTIAGYLLGSADNTAPQNTTD